MKLSKRSRTGKDKSTDRPTAHEITARDLPTGCAIRWNLKRKALVVSAVQGGLISLRDACARYELSIDEFLTWKRLALQNGIIAPCAVHKAELPPVTFKLAA